MASAPTTSLTSDATRPAPGDAGLAPADGSPAPAQLTLTGVTRRFGDFVAVDGIDLEIPSGEIFALLGPSGCGKTTTLRMIAGLERMDAGRIVMGERILADAGSGRSLPPERRELAMVFQSYAVWPHMTVAQNVEFPLRMRRVGRADRRRRVAEILEVTGLSAVADRSATLLSGGQQQRVALARALVYAPDLLLLDEPLSNLDAKLRTQMRHEIRRLNRELGTTMLFVTHDQDEALSLADQVAVMNKGRVEQVGRPVELYERPKTPFVRDFLGRLVMIEGILDRTGSGPRVLTRAEGLGQEHVTVDEAPPDLPDGARVGIFCRPEDLDIRARGDGPAGPNEVRAVVVSAAYLGDCLEYVLDVGGSTAVVTGTRRSVHAIGDIVLLAVDPARATVWPL
ncbi:ABC transporter ATP-binding protein [Micromonospora sp. NBC_01699]|uniref:ABC transporter ATP-binding protein n=1 Tax=Micromonospora sp. NBC_01699 TaxID=2975984 RepID=UPI002E307410|nr:ABC transporter ATP-binding protein [Micromonospora sp. NBC_01699]